MVGILYQSELTWDEDKTPCDEEDIPIVLGGHLICCGDWWTANFGYKNAVRVVGYKGELLFRNFIDQFERWEIGTSKAGSVA
jgi:hypothetical protein